MLTSLKSHTSLWSQPTMHLCSSSICGRSMTRKVNCGINMPCICWILEKEVTAWKRWGKPTKANCTELSLRKTLMSWLQRPGSSFICMSIRLADTMLRWNSSRTRHTNWLRYLMKSCCRWHSESRNFTGPYQDHHLFWLRALLCTDMCCFVVKKN